MLSNILLLVVALFGFAAASLTEIHPETGAAVPTTRRLGAHGSSTTTVSSSEQFRKIMEASALDGKRRLDDALCGTNSNFECSLGDTLFYGECGGLTERVDDNKWCLVDDGAGFCCGGSSYDCCELTGGGIAVVTVVILVIVFSIVLCSCACCR